VTGIDQHRVVYGFEAERTLRAGFVGCGGHAFRNIFPVLRYVPVDLVAVCDLDKGRAESFGRMFGAKASYVDYREMLAQENLDCIFVVTSYDGSGRVTHAEVAEDCLRAGVHTWVEKPPVNCLAEIEVLRTAMEVGRSVYAVGFKKAFTPAARHVRALLDAGAIGRVSTVSLRYPQALPTVEDFLDGERNVVRRSFLDHLGHPASLLQLLGGKVDSLIYSRGVNGAGFVQLQLASGAVASLQFAVGDSMKNFAERTEVSGDQGSIFIENGTRVTLAMHATVENGPQGSGATRDWVAGYGRDSDFTGQAADGCIVWEPEYSLGQLYNNGLFLLGYYNEIESFVRSAMTRTIMTVGGLDYAEEGIRLFEAFAEGPGKVISV
jgi:predicted dehydrogenase